MTRVKRFSALLLAALMAVSLIPASVFARAASPVRSDPETIVGWNFDTQTNVATSGNSNNASSTVTRENNVAVSFNDGGYNSTAHGIGSSSWDNASEDSPKYYELQVNASGYESLKFTAALRASGTGPKNLKLYYSVDGTNFVDTGLTYALAKGSWAKAFNSAALPEACNGAESLLLRVAVIDTVSSGDGTIADGGTLRMDEVTVTGTATGDTPEPTETAGPTETPDPVTVSTIAEVIAATEGTFTVQGVVTFIDSRNVYVQDDTAGICIFLNEDASGLALGDKVQATGTRASHKGLPELSGVDQTDETQFTKLSSGNELPLETVTIAQINENNAAYLCERVKIEGAVMGAVNNSGNTPITQGENSINIYKMTSEVTAVEGDTVDVIAVVGMYNTVQLRVAAAADVTVVTTPEPTETPDPDPEHITIKDALALEANQYGAVIGVVTFIDGRNVYVQDDTAAIDLYLNKNTVPSNLALGDRVYAYGKKTTYNALPELTDIDGSSETAFKVLSNGNELPQETVAIADLLAENAVNDYICERVLIKGATIGAINTSGNTALTQNESSINIFKIPSGVTAVEGDTVNVIAVVGMFNTVQLRVASASDVTVVTPLQDPIDPADYPDYKTIADILALTSTGTTETVVGQVTMFFGNYGTLNSFALGDVEDDEIIGLQVYNNTFAVSCNVGDIVAVTGKVSDYGGVRQIQDLTAVTVLSSEVEPMAAQEVTVSELNSNIDNYLSEFVVIKDAVLGAYSGGNSVNGGSTPITDADGATVNIYRAAAYPEGVVEGDTVDVYAVASKYVKNGSTTVQLRNGASSDYVQTSSSYITIAEARALETNATGTVRGVVTFIDGRNVYVQDSTAGIVLYLNKNTVPETLKIGDLVEATGARADYNGLPELSGIDGSSETAFKVISSDNALPVETVTIADLNADTDGAYMCERIKLVGVTLGAINTSGNTPVTQNESTINVFKIPAIDFAEGDTVDLIAIVSCYTNVQLRVVDASDVTEHIVYNDPITDDMIEEGVMTIPEVIAAADNTEVTVIAQLVYRFGNYDSINSAILEDIVDGEIYGLQMFNSLDDYVLGDVLKITATKTTYGGVPQIQSAKSTELVKHTDPIPAQRFDTFAEMNKEQLLSEYVMIRNVTLGTYNDNGSTTMTDSTEATMPVYRAYPYDKFLVQAGEVVDFCAALSKYNTTWQFRGGEYFGENKAPTVVLDNFLNAKVGVDYDVAATVVDDYGIETVVCEYTIGENTASVELTYNAANDKYVGTIAGSEITAGNSAMTLVFIATDTSGLTGTATVEVAIVDEPQIVSVSPAANSATYEDKTPEISVVFANAGEDPEVVITVTDVEGSTSVQGDKAVFDYEGELADGKYKATVTITRKDGVSATSSWSFTVGEPAFGYYFGQLHSHTAEYSDGAGTLADAYNYVMGLPESENVDFVAFTDHSNYFDNSSALGDFEDVESGLKASNGHSVWYNYTTTIDGFNDEQTDVVFLHGYEMTWNGSTGKYGHMNTYNSTGVVSRNNSAYTVSGGAGLIAYYDLIKQYPNTISAFNHPGTTFGNFDNFGYYDAAADNVIKMLEVGNGEGAIGGSAYFPSYDQYTLALDAGWHVAPTNNQDNHKGKWGNANTGRDVILTDNFSEEGIYEAIRNMTMYATEDKNLQIYYTLNDQLMGSIIPDNEENPVTELRFYVSVSDPDGEAVGTVSVIVNGGVVAYSQDVSDASAVLDFALPNNYSYYFIKVVQQDGDIAVTAPVWVGEVSKVGISDLTTDTALPVKGEEMTFDTALFDYEATDFVIESITYSITVGQKPAEILDIVENPGTIAAGSTLVQHYSYTPTALGRQYFTVSVVGYLGETMMQFSRNYDMDVLDPSEIVDIGIDAGHKNFYVAGGYPDYDAALIELCARNAVRAHRLEAGELTYENIKDYRLLVLTVPFIKANQAVTQYLYTDEEIAAIAEYAANGGNLVVCSKSDRKNPENENEHADVITNGILEAIGTDTRIANGIVVDTQEMQNQAFRLYFTSEDNYNYTWNDEPVWLLKDVLETTNNSFSGYNSAPVIAGENAIPIIKGYSTTWGANYTANFGNSDSYTPNYETDTVVVPMGEVVEMTLEDLPGGGWLITSGVTFFSTFEVQVEMENATTQQNSNYQIVMNIIKQVKPEPVITDIAEVNAAEEEGGKYTIEGYVTSNASGFDKETAFFDCIYVQDDTAGINVYPVAGDFHIGQLVRVTGVLGSYCGERELVVSNIEAVEGAEERIIEPTELSTADSMSPDWTGTLVKINGIVKELGYSSDGALETIMVDDGSGLARVFIDGYIMREYMIDVRVGDSVSAIGLASITVDTESGEESYIPRLRVRNRAEIVPGLPDVNGDGNVDELDVQYIMRVAMKLIDDYTDEQFELMDMNGDEKVTLVDALLYMRRLQGIA